jgi:hypothetical protein
MRIGNGFVAMVIAVASVTAFGSPVAAQSDDKKPAKAAEVSVEWKTYVEYVNALAKAQKLEDVFQYMQTTQVEFFKTFKPAMWPDVLQSLKNTMVGIGAFSGTMRLVREESEPTAKYLVLEATTPAGKKVQGRVKMVKETGWTKIASVPDDENWHDVK